MVQRLLISPEGVEATSQVDITEMEDPAGKNSVIVRNDAYETASDGTYENVE